MPPTAACLSGMLWLRWLARRERDVGWLCGSTHVRVRVAAGIVLAAGRLLGLQAALVVVEVLVVEVLVVEGEPWMALVVEQQVCGRMHSSSWCVTPAAGGRVRSWECSCKRLRLPCFVQLDAALQLRGFVKQVLGIVKMYAIESSSASSTTSHTTSKRPTA